MGGGVRGDASRAAMAAAGPRPRVAVAASRRAARRSHGHPERVEHCRRNPELRPHAQHHQARRRQADARDVARCARTLAP